MQYLIDTIQNLPLNTVNVVSQYNNNAHNERSFESGVSRNYSQGNGAKFLRHVDRRLRTSPPRLRRLSPSPD